VGRNEQNGLQTAHLSKNQVALLFSDIAGFKYSFNVLELYQPKANVFDGSHHILGGS